MATADFEKALLAEIPHLRAFARSFTQDPARADDFVQEALVKAWDKMASYTPGTNFRAWLFTILRNGVYSRHRKLKREIEDPDELHQTAFAVPGAQEAYLDLIDFGKAFAQLPADQREALLLVGAEGFSYDEAAEICGCAVGTIKSRVNRARAKLTELLGLDEAAEIEP